MIPKSLTVETKLTGFEKIWIRSYSESQNRARSVFSGSIFGLN